MNQLERAIIFATQAHGGAYRKTGNIPFIMHPLEVACIAATLTDDLDILAACVLHDVVEDTPVTLEEVITNFGERVGKFVEHETEDKRKGIDPRKTWEIRKLESLGILERSNDIAVKIMWLSDKLANMRSFHRLYKEEGSDLWKRFHQSDPKKQEWYYRSVLSFIGELKDTLAYKEYESLLNQVFPK